MKRGFAVILIGLDPHKRSHTAVALDETGQLLGVIKVTADKDMGPDCSPGPAGGHNAAGRSKERRVWVGRSPSSLWQLENRRLMSRRRWRPGRGWRDQSREQERSPRRPEHRRGGPASF